MTEIQWNTGEIKSGVLFGKNEYLFLYEGSHQQFPYLQGRITPRTSDVKNFSENIAKRAIFCRDRNKKYLHVVFPSKPVVMRENIPDPHGNIQSLYLSHYHGSTMEGTPIIYPLDLLLKEKATSPIYQRWDTHLTDWGSYCVTREILQIFGYSYDWKKYFAEEERTNIGELGIMLKFSHGISESVLTPKFHSLKFDNRPSLPGNRGNIAIHHNPKSQTNLKLVIFGDSFIKFCCSFFAPIFRSILYIRSPLFQKDIVDLFDPDMILSSNTERYLAAVQSDSDSKSVFLENYGAQNYNPGAPFVRALQAYLSAQHYPKVYETWSARAAHSIISFDGLNQCTKTNQARFTDVGALEFQSTGKDPWLLFPNAEFSPDCSYTLEIDMDSSIDSSATIYYTENIDGEASIAGLKLSEERKLAQPISQGRNSIKFQLPRIKLGRILRFDPATDEGIFKINRLKVIESN